MLLLLLIFVCVPASAQVYKRTGPDGNVYFSDTPGPDSTPVEVRPAQTISLPPVPQPVPAVEQPEDAAPAYKKLTIVSPTSEEDVRANDGNVTVRLSLQPGLRPGHAIGLTIDGEGGNKTQAGTAMTIELSNLSRGLHTVEATVVDSAGKALIQSGPVSFHVLRAAAGR